MKNKIKKLKIKKWKIIVAIVIILVVVIMAVSCISGSGNAAVVTVTNAYRGDIEETVSTSGTVLSEEKRVVFTKVSGRVDSVLVEAGDAVKKGDVLVAFDMADMEKRLKQAALQQTKSNALYLGAMSDNSDNVNKLTEANINLSVLNRQIEDNKAYLKDLQSKLKEDRRDTSNALITDNYDLNKRLTELTEKSNEYASVSDGDLLGKKNEIDAEIKEVQALIARNSYLQSIADSSDYVAEMEEEIANVQDRIASYEEYKARMESQKNGSEGMVFDTYDRQQYESDRELANLSYSEAEEEYYLAKQGICAEFNGIITECTVIPGAVVSDGVQLLTIENSDEVKVSFNASKYDAAKLEVGQKVDITISGNSYEGEVIKINRMASTGSSNTPMVGAHVHINNPDDKIILGLDAKLVIHTKQAKDALLVPVETVNADKNGDFLYVVESGVVKRRDVVCGISSESDMEIVEGITENDQIVLSSYGIVEEGMNVTVIQQ